MKISLLFRCHKLPSSVLSTPGYKDLVHDWQNQHLKCKRSYKKGPSVIQKALQSAEWSTKGCSCRESLYTWAGQDNTVLLSRDFPCYRERMFCSHSVLCWVETITEGHEQLSSETYKTFPCMELRKCVNSLSITPVIVITHSGIR